MIVENGLITQLSVSQVEAFDPQQTGGCPRRWWFERANDLKPEQTRGQSEGEAGHALLATYLATGAKPVGRVKMGKAVTGAIVKGDLPAPGGDLLIEQRFSGQEKFDASVCECGHAPSAHVHGENACTSCDCTEFRARWIPLDVTETLHIAGVPFEGFIDLAFRRDGPGQWGGGIPTIVDHKFSADIHAYAKKPSELIRTVQLPVYVLSQAPYWPDAKTWRIAHHYVSKRGVDSFVRSAVVTLDDVLERKADIESVIEHMKQVARAEKQNDVPHARRPGSARNPCEAWAGCPHQSICSAFRSSTAALTTGAPPVQLTPEEAAALGDFGDLDGVTIDAPPAAPAAAESKPRREMKIVNACVCGAEITAENGSQLRDGYWLHVDCEAQAKQRADAKAKKAAAEAAKPPPPTVAQIPVSVLPPDAPASKPELASEQPPAPKEPKARKPRAAAAPTIPTPTAAIAAALDVATAPLDPPAPKIGAAVELGTPRAAAVASVLRSIAALLET